MGMSPSPTEAGVVDGSKALGLTKELLQHPLPSLPHGTVTLARGAGSQGQRHSREAFQALREDKHGSGEARMIQFHITGHC